MATTTDDRDFLRVDGDAFGACPSESIDYAVMENTDRAVVVPLDVGWDDVGAWSALWDTAQKDGTATPWSATETTSCWSRAATTTYGPTTGSSPRSA